MMPRIEIPRRHYLLYLLLPHPAKVALLDPASRAKLDRINDDFNKRMYSGEGARRYDEIHGYTEDAQHAYPARPLVQRVWAPGGFGTALELGGGSGYFTCLIARRADRVVTVEPVCDMQTMLRSRCDAEGIDNVEVLGASTFDLDLELPPASFDSALVIQSLHHFHRRPEVFAALARLVRPGGRLFLLEPHHNVKRVARLAVKYLRQYRAPAFRKDEAHWATHDFLTHGEVRALCRRAGFGEVRVTGYWLPYLRRLVPDADRRFRLERRLGRWPVVRHLASLLALEARRLP